MRFLKYTTFSFFMFLLLTSSAWPSDDQSSLMQTTTATDAKSAKSTKHAINKHPKHKYASHQKVNHQQMKHISHVKLTKHTHQSIHTNSAKVHAARVKSAVNPKIKHAAKKTSFVKSAHTNKHTLLTRAGSRPKGMNVVAPTKHHVVASNKMTKNVKLATATNSKKTKLPKLMHLTSNINYTKQAISSQQLMLATTSLQPASAPNLHRVTKPSSTVNVTHHSIKTRSAKPQNLLFNDMSSDTRGFYIGTGIGQLYPAIAKNNLVATGQGWPDDRYVSKSVTDNPAFLLTGGYTWGRPNVWLPYYSLGLKYMYASPVEVKGYIEQYSLPQFRNYNFQYHIQQQNLMGVAKVDIVRWHHVMPYLTAGAGLSINHVFAYEEQALSNVTPRVSPGFSSRINTNFAYDVGAGIDYIFKKNIWFNVEYNYGDYGVVKTGRGANTSTGTGVNYSHAALKNNLTENTILLGVTYYPG